MEISTKRILFPAPNGGVGFHLPGAGWEPMEVARKDTPPGVPFRIVDVSDIPEKDETRNRWMADFSHPDGFGIGAKAWFAEREAARRAEEIEAGDPPGEERGAGQ
jgi:hypothetical protein